MFPELAKYTTKGHFVFHVTDRLSDVCNAPADKSGVYLVYGKRKNKPELLYVGISGGRGANGKILPRKGGIRDRILNSKQFGDRRKITWPAKMKEQEIEVLDIYWYITWDTLIKDFPREVEVLLLKKNRELTGRLPEWNTWVMKGLKG